MTNLDRYSFGHFRWLLLSRFNYTNIHSLVRLRCCKVIALVPPSHYDIIALAYILGFGLVPRIKVYKKKRWGRGGRYNMALVTIQISSLWRYFGNMYLFKANSFYFPCIDAADPKADFVFVVKGVAAKTSQYAAPYLLEGVIEVLNVLGGKKLYKGFVNEWSVRWTFTTTKVVSFAEHSTPLRGMGFGSTNIKPRVSLFDKE